MVDTGEIWRNHQRAEDQQEIDTLKQRIAELESALRCCMTALDDWLHIYADDCCSDESVFESKERVAEAGGPIGYIAGVQQMNRNTMAAAKGRQQT